MGLQNTALKGFLDRSHPFTWKASLPLIIPEYLGLDIEQVLETKKSQEKFKLLLNFFSETPCSLDEYIAHEESAWSFFQFILNRRFKINTVIFSTISHYLILKNEENEYVQWKNFLMDFESIKEDEIHDYQPTYIGIKGVKYLSIIMEYKHFEKIESSIQQAGFLYECSNYFFDGVPREIPVYILKIPVGSIIHMALQP